MGSEPRFYVLRDVWDGPHDTTFSKAFESERAGAPRCPSCGAFIGMREWLPPFPAELEVYGEMLGDLVRGASGDVLASERFMEAFRSEKLTGVVSFEPVKIVKVVRKKRGPKITSTPRYYFLKPCFGRAAVDEARSRLRRTEPIECAECRSTGLEGIYGFRFEPGTWQGEDLFRPRGLQSEIVVSECFAEFVKDHGFTNIKLIPIEEFEWDPLRVGPPART